MLFVITNKVFRADFWSSLLISIVTSICVLQLIPSTAESFYWNAAATTYTTATALFFIVIGLTVLMVCRKDKHFTLVCMIFCSLLILVLLRRKFYYVIRQRNPFCACRLPSVARQKQSMENGFTSRPRLHPVIHYHCDRARQCRSKINRRRSKSICHNGNHSVNPVWILLFNKGNISLPMVMRRSVVTVFR